MGFYEVGENSTSFNFAEKKWQFTEKKLTALKEVTFLQRQNDKEVTAMSYNCG